MTRFNDYDTGVAILIMQRLHELDLAGVFLADGGWEHVRPEGPIKYAMTCGLRGEENPPE